MTKWEYKIIQDYLKHNYHTRKDMLNNMGNEGWELAAIETWLSSDPLYIFKRRMQKTETSDGSDNAD